MAEAAPLAFNVSVPSDGLQGRTLLEKPLHKWLDGTDEAGRRLKYVLWGPGGVGKSTLTIKFAAGQAERGGGWLRLVFRLSASSMEQDYAGLLDAMLGKSVGRAPSCAAEEVRGRVHELLQSPAWSRAWLSVRRPACAGRRRAGEGRARVADGRVSVGAWADHHHDAGYRVGAAGGGLSGSERARPATGRDWRFSTTCLRRRRAGEGRARVADGRVPVGA